MNIGIVTFHSVHNFGAVLQAYGLQEYLVSLGHNVYIVDYYPEYLKERYKTFSYSRVVSNSGLSKYKSIIREILVYPVRKRRAVYFNRFIRKSLRLYSLDVLDLNNDFDAFVFGSDQIWNPLICRGFDPMFFGDYKSIKDKRLVAYAPSVGSLKHFDDKQKKTFLEKLTPFHAISCREADLAKFISQGLDRFVPAVLDPTLLAGREIFEKIATPMDKQKPYLLLFTLGNNDRTSAIAYNIAKKKGLRVIEIVSYQISIAKRSAKQAVSVNDFLGYIHSAEVVVTSSFHGTAFSILFGRDLYYVPDDPKTGERAANLLQMLGLGNRVWDANNDMDTVSIDYTHVNAILAAERKKSAEFIKSAIEK